MAVDNLTRICAGIEKKDVFYVAVKGASRATKNGNSGALEKAIYLLSGITGADDQSVINACKLATYEVWARSIGYNGLDGKGQMKQILMKTQSITFRRFILYPGKIVYKN
ncbi:MAG: hypothetical protein IJH70_06555 [Oscillospiraceae bacterium]|nr:hypothetical protein [Oscillospiraceae bacterium]